jgi:hypothetical protein
MRALVLVSVLFVVTACTRGAFAWDGAQYWFHAADADPGAGGILGMGGARDYTITCANCHVKGAGQIGLTLTLDGAPPPAMYRPGHTYQVTAAITGEHLFCMDPSMNATGNHNEIGFTAEDDSGNVAGGFGADYGSSASCPQAPPDNQTFTGTTLTYGDCHGVNTTGGNVTSWSFSWTAPAAGSGRVTLYYVGVDGNCMMDSFNDDVKVANVKMGEGTAALRPRTPSNNALAWIGMIPAVGIAVALRRRRAR